MSTTPPSDKACKRCEITKPISEFYVHVMMGDGYLSFCKDCTKARIHKHRAEGRAKATDDAREQTEHRRNWHKAYVKRPDVAALISEASRIGNPARSAVYAAIKRGDLVRPSYCEECWSESFIEAAHHDYDKPLDVRWLCRSCHRRWDAQESKLFRGLREAVAP